MNIWHIMIFVVALLVLFVVPVLKGKKVFKIKKNFRNSKELGQEWFDQVINNEK